MNDKLQRLWGVFFTKNPRNAMVFISALTVGAKPLGLLKNLMVAWLFGASIFMDGFNMALGILGFLVGIAPNALENAIFPALARARVAGSDEDCTLMAWTFWVLGTAALALGVVLVLWGPAVVRFFAPGFEGPRLEAAVVMLWLMLPYAMAVVVRAPLEVWANHTERFVLPQFSQSFVSLVWIVVMLLTYWWIGAYAVAAGMSVAVLSSTGLLVWTLRDFPWRLSRLPAGIFVRGLGRDFLLCLALTGASALYTVVDRYFASMLPVGDLTALSNGIMFYSVAFGVMTESVLIFFARSSRIAAEENQGLAGEGLREVSFVALAIGWTVALPAGVALAALAAPLLKLLLGYGAYKDAVGTTVVCLSLYALGFVGNLLTTVLYRLAQAGGMLWKIIVWSFCFVGMNALLDWLLVGMWGAAGLALATTLVVNLALGVYVLGLLPDFPRRFMSWHPMGQLTLAVFWGGALWILGNRTPLWSLVVLLLGGGAFVGHLWLCERLGWLDYLPPRWRPSAFWEMGMSRWRSWRAKGAAR